MFASSGLMTAPCGVPCFGFPFLQAVQHALLQERLDQAPAPGRPRSVPAPGPSADRAGSCRSSSSGRRPPRTRSPPSAAHRPVAARPCSPVRAESRSCARQSPARRSVPSRAATPSAPRDRAPRECPTAASPLLPGLGIHTRRTACGRYVPSRSCSLQLLPVRFQIVRSNCSTVCVIDPGRPCVGRDLAAARQQVALRDTPCQSD